MINMTYVSEDGFLNEALAILESIESWRMIDEKSTVPDARVDESGFWRLPLSTAEELAGPFETDQGVLGGFGQTSGAEGVIHFYQPSALILGKLDRKLPRFGEAEVWAEGEGIPRVLRISGGQAIVSDNGVLNLSLILPKPHLPFRDGFLLMAEVVRACLRRVTGLELDVGRVPGSYCPGDFDLSFGGKKVAGIAQRRVKNAVALMAYVSVSGDQQARARLVREYYRRGGADAADAAGGGAVGCDGGADAADERFPLVDPAVMTQVQDLVFDGSPDAGMSAEIGVEMIKQHFLDVLGACGR